jgi:outer membrane lipoprotein SlyB
MRRILALRLLPLLALGACSAAVPTGPTVVAMPGQGKNWDQFQADDSYCKAYASSQIPPAGRITADTQNNSAATAAAGTLLGAGLGAAIGAAAGSPGMGAAVGSAAGLLSGTSAASNRTQAAADSLQGRYDISYAQCMAGHGETVTPPAVAVPVYGAPIYYYAPPVYYAAY